MRTSKDTKNKILGCARKMIKNDNIDFSMRNIAKECNITQGTIYIHFKNKDELLAQIMIDDWHKSLLKMKKVVSTCDSYQKGLVGLARIIREFSKSYWKVWDSYKTNATYTSSKKTRHEELINEIKEYVKILNKRFLKGDINITKILSEIVLACGSDYEASLKELENLGRLIIKEK